MKKIITRTLILCFIALMTAFKANAQLLTLSTFPSNTGTVQLIPCLDSLQVTINYQIGAFDTIYFYYPDFLQPLGNIASIPSEQTTVDGIEDTLM